MRILIVLALLVAVVGAQEKPLDVAGLVREVEFLKRENAALKAALRDRDTRINLAQQEREFIIKSLTGDTGEGDRKARCATVEQQLRELEKPKAGTTFDCEALTFKEAPK